MSSQSGYYSSVQNFLSLLDRPTLTRFEKLKTDEERFKFVSSLDFVRSSFAVRPTEGYSKSLTEAVKVRKEGNQYYTNGQLDDALNCYNRCIALAPPPPTFPAEKSGVAKASSKGKKAESSRETELSLALGNRSACLLQMRKFESCLEDICLALHYGYPQQLQYKVYDRKGRALIELDRLKEANEAFEKGISLLRDVTSLKQEQKNEIEKGILEKLQQCVISDDESDRLTSRPQPHRENNDDTSSTSAKESLTVPRISGSANPQYPGASDAFDVLYSPERGRYAVATRKVAVGDVLMVETPHASVLGEDFFGLRCYHCFAAIVLPYACHGCTKEHIQVSQALHSQGYLDPYLCIAKYRTQGLNLQDDFMTSRCGHYVVNNHDANYYQIYFQVLKYTAIHPVAWARCGIGSPLQKLCPACRRNRLMNFTWTHILRRRDMVRNIKMVCAQRALRYCGDKCRQDSWESHHAVECPYMELLISSGTGPLARLALKTVLVTGLDRLLKHKNNPAVDSAEAQQSLFADGGVYVGGYAAVYSLVTHSASRPVTDLLQYTILAVWLVRLLQKAGFFQEIGNSIPNTVADRKTADAHLTSIVGGILLHILQVISCNGLEITEMTIAETLHKSHPLTIGLAVYPTLSLLNHSCDPSVELIFYRNTCVARAIQKVDAGDELPIDYGFVYYSTAKEQRQSALRSQYLFDCNCLACFADWGLTAKLMSGVPYFRCGECSSHLPSVVKYHESGSDKELVCPGCQVSYDPMERVGQLHYSQSRAERAIEEARRFLIDKSVPILESHMTLMHDCLVLPWKEYVTCLSTLKQCYRLQGNRRKR